MTVGKRAVLTGATPPHEFALLGTEPPLRRAGPGAGEAVRTLALAATAPFAQDPGFSEHRLNVPCGFCPGSCPSSGRTGRYEQTVSHGHGTKAVMPSCLPCPRTDTTALSEGGKPGRLSASKRPQTKSHGFTDRANLSLSARCARQLARRRT